MQEFDVTTIGRRSTQGVLALISRQSLLNLLSFIASLVIFTFLSTKEIGVYVAVVAMQRVISFFTDFGLGASLIQKKEEIKQSDLSTVFTIQASVTFFVFILIVLAQNAIVSYFRLDGAATRLLLVLAFTVFLSSFKFIPSILLERHIQFSKLVIPQIVESLVFNFFLIILVIRGFGLDSYSVAFIASSIIGIPIYYLISPWKISIGINRQSLKNLKYGIQFQSKNILATIKDDFLTLFLAKLLTFTELGYIGFAQRNAFFTFRFVVDNVTKVTFSTYSRIQQDALLLKKAIEKSFFFVSLTIFPLLTGLIITAPYFIQYIPKWQGKWEPAVLSLMFFSLNALVSSLSAVLVTVLDATGRVKTTLKLMILWTSLTWILTPVFVFFVGYNGVAISSFLISLTIAYTLYIVKQFVKFNLIRSLYKPLISTIIMASVVFLCTKILVYDFVSLLFVILIGVALYCLSMYLLAKEDLKKDIAFLTRKT